MFRIDRAAADYIKSKSGSVVIELAFEPAIGG